jgi:hypothetical protein
MKIKLALFVMLTSFMTLTPEATARYGAIAYSTGDDSFGVVGLTWNWKTRSSAISGAIREARDQSDYGYLDGYKTYWWSHKGYNAAARGFSDDDMHVKVGWSYGWRTASGSINAALRKVNPYDYPVDRGYVYGFNR